MSEDPRVRLDERGPFETRVLAELADLKAVLTRKIDALDERLTALEEKVNARLREARPIWEAVLSRLDVMNSKFDVLNRDLLETRAETDLLKRRLPPAA